MCVKCNEFNAPANMETCHLCCYANKEVLDGDIFLCRLNLTNSICLFEKCDSGILFGHLFYLFVHFGASLQELNSLICVNVSTLLI